jgi:hypothetical protein
LAHFFFYPFRCQTCGHRFYVRQAGKTYEAGSDKRQNLRVPAQFPVSFRGKQVEGKGTLIDVSVRGCALQTNASLSRGDVLQVTFRMTDGRPSLDIDAAVVRYIQGVRVGLEFVRIAEKPDQELREFVESRLKYKQP